VINLYPKRFDPVPYDANLTEQWIPVDRMLPAAYFLWGLTAVQVCESNGKSHTARSVLETAGYEGGSEAIRYSLRRESGLLADGTRRDRFDPLASHDLIAVSTLDDAVELDDIALITGKALVVDRDWRPSALLDAELSLLDPVAVRRIECLWPGSAPRGMPSVEMCWDATSHLGKTRSRCVSERRRTSPRG